MLLEVRNINKTYGTNHVLKDVSFTARSNHSLGLLGRNGHGKTTTMKIMMGIIFGDSGEVLLDGAPLNPKNVKLGYLPEERGLYQKIKVLDQMVYFGKLRGMSSPQAKKSATDLLEKLEMTEYTKRNAVTLSKGNQQKVQLAIALLNDPELIILDEPFSGLDPVNARVLQDLIEESVKKSKMIIFSSHQMSQVEEFCQDVCIIKFGKVMLTGSLREIKDSYPKDKLYVVPELGQEAALKAVIGGEVSRYVKGVEEKADGAVLALRDEGDKNRAIQALADSGVGFNSITILRPSLLDIFLEKVGEDIEES